VVKKTLSYLLPKMTQKVLELRAHYFSTSVVLCCVVQYGVSRACKEHDSEIAFFLRHYFRL
jgi:hypothetical protein